MGDAGQWDLAAILEVVHSHEVAAVGVADSTSEHLRAMLDDPTVDPAASVVVTDAGRIVGLRLVNVVPAERDVVVDAWVATWLPAVLQAGLMADLTLDLPDLANRLADRVEPGRQPTPSDHDWQGSTTVWQLVAGAYRVDPIWRDALAAVGLRPVRTFERLRLDHGLHVNPPVPPPGVTARLAQSVADLQVVHRVHLESFADHWGGEAQRPFDEWLTYQRSEGGYREDLWTIAELDGEPVGFSAGSDVRLDFGCHYVTYLGVLGHARGRGVATYLLRREFWQAASRGLAVTELAVDSASQTGADRLYRAVGMVAYRTVDFWLAPVEGRPQTSA